MENSREEITFVENEIKNTRRSFEEVGCHVFFDEDLCKAIEHILSDYKRVLKENEELHKEIERMKSLDIYKLVEDWETGQLIPIQKIKAKIEELDIEISTCEYADDDSEEYKQEVEKDKTELLMAKKVLQQLLESEEGK